jgi:hypothetical protein
VVESPSSLSSMVRLAVHSACVRYVGAPAEVEAGKCGEAAHCTIIALKGEDDVRPIVLQDMIQG